jgi:hypothetical protein
MHLKDLVMLNMSYQWQTDDDDDDDDDNNNNNNNQLFL